MSAWKLGVTLVGCILLAACTGGLGSDLDDVEPAPSIPVKNTQFEAVILLPGDWVPSNDQVLALEERVVAYLTQQADLFDSLQAPIEERLPGYRRQYWGVLENDTQLIVANFFCNGAHNWTERAVMVLDGGDCYFRLHYDPATGIFSDLEINGSA